MATPEFEIYLAVLGRSLQLSRPESRELAAELSDHFEERLADLLDGGVERSRAVRMVLEEFGEAAELAARFADLASLRRRRRWMMRATVGTCLAGAAMAGLVFFAPGPAPIAPQAVAQTAPADPMAELKGEAAKGSEGGASVDVVPVKPISTAIDPTSFEIERKLENESIQLDFQENPFSEVIDYIAQVAKVDIILHENDFESSSIELSMPVTLSMSEAKLNARMALQLLMQKLGPDFDFLVRNGVVEIGFTETLDSTRIYDCRRMIERAGDVGQVIEAIQRNVAPDSWRSNSKKYLYGHAGGVSGAAAVAGSAGMESARSGNNLAVTVTPEVMGMVQGDLSNDEGKTASISAVGGLLVITQSPRAHRQIEDLLKQLEVVLSE